MSLLIMLLLFSILIIAHELGHFWVAKKCGVKVERFGFGLPFGGTLWSKKIGETELCIHPALFGGYVSFPDDDEESDVPEDSPRRFENQPLGNRFAIAIAGITVNAIMGWFIMAGVFMAWGMPNPNVEAIKISQVVIEDGPAAKAGIKGGETLIAVDGTKVMDLPYRERLYLLPLTTIMNANRPVQLTLGTQDPETKKVLEKQITVTPNENGQIGVIPQEYYGDQGKVLGIKVVMIAEEGGPADQAGIQPNEIVTAINEIEITSLPPEDRAGFLNKTFAENKGLPVSVTLDYQAEGSTEVTSRKVTVTPNEKGLIGIGITPVWENPIPKRVSADVFTALSESYHSLAFSIKQNFQALGYLVTGQMNLNQLGGPIRIVKEGSDIIEQNGIRQGLELIATISVILAVMNLLPIPALDGGHILFMALELVKGSPVKKEVQEKVTQASFFALLAFMVFIVFIDINNIWINPANKRISKETQSIQTEVKKTSPQQTETTTNK